MNKYKCQTKCKPNYLTRRYFWQCFLILAMTIQRLKLTETLLMCLHHFVATSSHWCKSKDYCTQTPTKGTHGLLPVENLIVWSLRMSFQTISLSAPVKGSTTPHLNDSSPQKHYGRERGSRRNRRRKQPYCCLLAFLHQHGFHCCRPFCPWEIKLDTKLPA